MRVADIEVAVVEEQDLLDLGVETRVRARSLRSISANSSPMLSLRGKKPILRADVTAAPVECDPAFEVEEVHLSHLEADPSRLADPDVRLGG